MIDILERLVALFCIIVFISFMVNHGHMDFSGLDWVVGKTKEAINSSEGQELIAETKETAVTVGKELFGATKEVVTEAVTSSKENNKNAEMVAASYLGVNSTNSIKVSINGEEKNVKLIGIKNIQGEYSSAINEYFSSIMENIGTVYLEYDIVNKDDEGNILAYVWIDSSNSSPSNNMINSILIKNGYAIDSVLLPNNKYTELFIELKNTAQNNKTGLWINNDFN